MFYRKLLILVMLICSSCSTYFNQPTSFTEAQYGESTGITKRLQNLPKPEEKVVVGVYNFRDLTGQYKASEAGSTFSTAVTQGGTAILINALEESGWFTPIERENIGNLLNERNIIRSTRQEYEGNGESQSQLPPLLFAGVLLEGGIVSYDTNIITGGMGARYFGVGGSTQYRQDRVTVYLRAISTSSGKILKNIYISKTILSQALSGNLFKYVNFQRLMEAEVGFTRNEPVQLAVKEAIEKAVEGLIIEGLQDDLWKTKDGDEVKDKLISEYKIELEDVQEAGLYNNKFVERRFGSSLGVGIGGSIISGDYSQERLMPLVRLNYENKFSNNFTFNLALSGFTLKNSTQFERTFLGFDTNLQYLVLPDDDFTPFLYGGPGILFGLEDDKTPSNAQSSFFKLQYGIGLDYFINEKLSFKIFGEHSLLLSDELDYRINGKRNDFIYNFGIGVSFHLGKTEQQKN